MFVNVLKGIRDAVFTIIMIPFLIVQLILLVAMSIMYVLFGYTSVKKFWAWGKQSVEYTVDVSDDYLEY
jgi:hypothetical protein